MNTKQRILTAIVGITLLTAGTVYAQKKPPVDVGRKHPNIEAAQKLVQQAWDRVVLAQKANEFDLGGHAEKARVLLDQASKELKLAAEAANK